MTLQIGLEGSDPHEVLLTRSGSRAIVMIDGHAVTASFAERDDACILDIDGQRETIFAVTDRDTVFVHAYGRSWTLQVSDSVETSLRGDDRSDVAAAPMPGVLVSIAVAAGDEIHQGQVLAVIESMKMQTQILAPRDGVVAGVQVELGANFESGAPLVTLYPEVGSDEETN